MQCEDRNSDRNNELFNALMAFEEWERQAFLMRRFDNLRTEHIARIVKRQPAEVDSAILRVFTRVTEATVHG